MYYVAKIKSHCPEQVFHSFRTHLLAGEMTITVTRESWEGGDKFNVTLPTTLPPSEVVISVRSKKYQKGEDGRGLFEQTLKEICSSFDNYEVRCVCDHTVRELAMWLWPLNPSIPKMKPSYPGFSKLNVDMTYCEQ